MSLRAGAVATLFLGIALLRESASFLVRGSQFAGGGGFIDFVDDSSAATASFTIDGPLRTDGGAGFIQFFDSATPDHATFFVNGSEASGTTGGILFFRFESSAANASIINIGPDATVDGGSGLTWFFENSNAGNASLYTLGGSLGGAPGGQIDFYDNTSAANASVNIESGTTFNAQGGIVSFSVNSTAANGTFTLGGVTTSAGFGGSLYFRDDSSADHATVTAQGATASSDALSGPTVIFLEQATAGEALFTCEGGRVSGGPGGVLVFAATSTAGQATLIAADGAVNNADGGAIFFYEDSTGDSARLELFGNGKLDLSIHSRTGMMIGSIEGDGNIFLGAAEFAVGNNDLSTSFSGPIQDGGLNGGMDGSLRKVGSGSLTLKGANSYSGGTVVQAGALVLAARRGSATGKGPVQVSGGTLAGTGTVRGNISVGNGVGSQVAPGNSAPGILTTQGTLTFMADGQYDCDIDLRKGSSDRFNAKGANLNGIISLVSVRSGQSIPGTVFTVISNTAAQPIVGTFANLPDGSVVTLAGNKLKASYEGGDGNDLTLTVIP